MSKGKRQQPIPQPRHQAPANRAWDELKDLSEETTRLLHASIGGAREAILSAVEAPIDPVERHQLTALIGRDSKALTDRLTALRREHEQRSGSAATPDELVKTLDIGGRYADLMSDTQTTLLVNTSRLTELMIDHIEPATAAPEPSTTEA